MSGEYFLKFPKVVYANTISTNIMVRPRIKDELKKYLSTYYYYNIKSTERPDNVAHSYYKRAQLSWLIFLANDIVDPLMQWYKDDQTLQNYIISKYESVENSLVKTAYYRVNWNSDTTKISTAQYEALPANRRRYWDRAFSSDQGDETYWLIEEDKRDYSKTISYERAKLDYILETNKILQINYTQTSGTDQIIVGDIIRRYSSGALVASGEVVDVDAGSAKLKNIIESGNGFNANNSYSFEVRNKNNALTVTDRQELAVCIPNDEVIYWEPVTYYTYETELNESRRVISLLDSRYSLQADRDLRVVMSR